VFPAREECEKKVHNLMKNELRLREASLALHENPLFHEGADIDQYLIEASEADQACARVFDVDDDIDSGDSDQQETKNVGMWSQLRFSPTAMR